MLRAVFDTVVFVRALINPYSISGRLIFQHYRRYRLVLSEPVAREILEVLHRPELTSKFCSLQGLDVRRVLELIGQAELVNLTDIPQVSRDPKDDKFLATAQAAAADYLVSEDQDLLVLGEYAGIPVVTGAAFLALLERQEGSG